MNTRAVSNSFCLRYLCSDGGILLVHVRRDVLCEVLFSFKRLVAMVVPVLKLSSFCNTYDAPLVHI
jgi:hypothetical protein